jgi:hypothetical protein
MVRVVCILVVVLGIGVSAAGQTTRPVDRAAPTTPAVAPPATAEAVAEAAVAAPELQAWPKAVEAFAAALVRGDAASAESALTSRSLLRRFDGSAGVEVARLTERTAKATLIGQHGYLHPPLVMAADIAADFKNATVVPDKAKVKFLVDDPAEIKRANATAVQWVVEQLNARAGMPVGVIVLWTPRPPVPGATTSEPVVYDTVFVLCRGEEVGPQEFKIDTVVFGSPIGEQN